MNHQVLIATVTIALAGSLGGFLRYNFEPAKISFGDTGSMFIGFMLGTLTMIGSYTTRNNVGYLAPFILLGLPQFDTLFVSYVRLRRGLPMIRGSDDHFALRLRKWRLSTKQTVLCSYLITLILGGATLMIIHVSNLMAISIISIVVVLAFLLGCLLKKVDMSL